MAKNYFNRYAWLIDTIQQHGYLTFSDISDLWQRSAINEDGAPLPERTFLITVMPFWIFSGLKSSLIKHSATTLLMRIQIQMG